MNSRKDYTVQEKHVVAEQFEKSCNVGFRTMLRGSFSGKVCGKEHLISWRKSVGELKTTGEHVKFMELHLRRLFVDSSGQLKLRMQKQ